MKGQERFCPVCDMAGAENIIENEERFLIHSLKMTNQGKYLNCVLTGFFPT